MVQNSLVKYIREQIRAGYDINTIKNYLLKYGYPKSRVNEALQFAYPPTAIKHVVHPSRTTIVLIVSIVCSLVLIAAAGFMFLRPGSQLLDVEIDLVSDSIEPGESLGFTTQIFNLGKAKGYDVSLKYEIYDLKDKLVKFKEETIAIETRASSSVVIELGGVEPGNYYLKATAFYSDKTARATSSFRVVKKTEDVEPEVIEPEIPAEPVKACPFSCDDYDKCTNDYCSQETGYECRHDKISPCCGNGVCEDKENYENCLADCKVPAGKEEGILGGKPVWEKIEIIKDIAKTDKNKALGYCNEIEQTSFRYDCLSKVAVSSDDDNICVNIEDDSYKDSCYKEFATTNKNSEVCAKIIKDSKRDQCYMDFATKGDYSVCDKLINKYLKQSCESLQRLSEVEV
jgi:hypothetical protein